MKVISPGLDFLNSRCLRNIHMIYPDAAQLITYLSTGNIKFRFSGMIGRITVPPKCPHTNPQNL